MLENPRGKTKNQAKLQNESSLKRGGLMRLATYASVLTAFILIVLKIIAFVLTGSMAILATMVDSCLDLLASFINMLAVKQATLPADHNHRFGHGKFESLAGLGQSTFVFGSGVFLMLASLAKIGKGEELEYLSLGIGVMLLSIVLTTALVLTQSYVVKKTKSVAIEADKAHYTGDLLINLSVIASLCITKFCNLPFLDSLFAVIIALYLMYVAFGVFKTSLRMLTDCEIDDEDRKKMLGVMQTNPYVRGVHDFRTRFSGDKLFVQAHLEIDAEFSLAKAHSIADMVEDEIVRLYPNAEVLIHQDPAGLFENHPELWYDLKSENELIKEKEDNGKENEPKL